MLTLLLVNCIDPPCIQVKYDNYLNSHTDGSDYSGFAGIDFTFDSTTLTVDALVPLIDDAIFELTEQFGASLAFPGTPSPRVTLAPDAAQVTILDDDGQLVPAENIIACLLLDCNKNNMHQLT